MGERALLHKGRKEKSLFPTLVARSDRVRKHLVLFDLAATEEEMSQKNKVSTVKLAILIAIAGSYLAVIQFLPGAEWMNRQLLREGIVTFTAIALTLLLVFGKWYIKVIVVLVVLGTMYSIVTKIGWPLSPYHPILILKNAVISFVIVAAFWLTTKFLKIELW